MGMDEDVALLHVLNEYKEGRLTTQELQIHFYSCMNMAYNTGLEECLQVLEPVKQVIPQFITVISSLKLPENWEDMGNV